LIDVKSAESEEPFYIFAQIQILTNEKGSFSLP